MAKEKPKRTRLSFDKESIDPAISHMFFTVYAMVIESVQAN